MKALIVAFLNLYQKFLSPILPPACRFTPTCSEYTKQAFQNYPLGTAFLLSVKRILRCHPWSEGYEDPLPLPKKKS